MADKKPIRFTARQDLIFLLSEPLSVRPARPRDEVRAALGELSDMELTMLALGFILKKTSFI